MKNLSFIIVYSGADKCDLYITDYCQDSTKLLLTMMENTVNYVIKNNSTFNIEFCRNYLKKTPYNLARTFIDLPVSLTVDPFIGDANLTNVYLCDFTVDLQNKKLPALYRARGERLAWKVLLSDVIHDLRNNPTGANGRKTDKLQNVKVYSISDESKNLRKPAIGSLEYFKKSAEAIALDSHNTAYVCEHIGDKKEIVYIAKYINSNKLQSLTLPTKIDYDVWRSNHFEVRVNDNEALRFSCEKADVRCVESGYIIKAYFYLTKTTRAILDSALYKIGTTHNVEVILYSPDCSSKVESGNSNAILIEKRFTCTRASKGDPLLIELTFVTRD